MSEKQNLPDDWYLDFIADIKAFWVHIKDINVVSQLQ
jgi:hypothetical protein